MSDASTLTDTLLIVNDKWLGNVTKSIAGPYLTFLCCHDNAALQP